MKQPTKEQLNDPKWWAMNAPEGATHVDKHGTFYKLVVHKMFSYTNVICQLSAWVQTKPIPLHELIERPEPMKEWRGMQDGLPPVGTDCLATWLEPPDGGGRLPEPVLIKGYNGDKRTQVWFARTNGEDIVHLVANCLFEPIKTEAEQGRDNFAVEVVENFAHEEAYYRELSMISEVARKMYDAGYRKQMSQAEANDVLMNRPFYVPAPERRALLDKLGFKE